jgi:hypothetical protein
LPCKVLLKIAETQFQHWAKIDPNSQVGNTLEMILPLKKAAHLFYKTLYVHKMQYRSFNYKILHCV